MANLHEIKARIGNVDATKKITRAMYLISASKSQKAKSQLEGVTPYFEQITSNMAEMLAGSEDISTPSPYIVNEPHANATRNLYLVMGGDKGMAGGYNHSLMDIVAENVNKEEDDVLVAGFLFRLQMRQLGYRVDPVLHCPVMNPSLYRARDVADLVIEKYHTHEYKAIFLIFTEKISPIQLEPKVIQLLPLNVAAIGKYAPTAGHIEEIEYLPSPHEVFDHLVPHYLKGIIYNGFVEAFASEQQARMMAMDGATKNADDTIARLNITYNRARQSKITQELTEIIGGIPEE